MKRERLLQRLSALTAVCMTVVIVVLYKTHYVVYIYHPTFLGRAMENAGPLGDRVLALPVLNELLLSSEWVPGLDDQNAAIACTVLAGLGLALCGACRRWLVGQRARCAGYFLGIALSTLVPLATVTKAEQWDDYLLEQLFVQLYPAFFLLLGYLVLIGRNRVSLCLGVLFTLMAVYHFLAVVGPLLGRGTDQAFSDARGTALLIAIMALMITGGFAWINYLAWSPARSPNAPR